LKVGSTGIHIDFYSSLASKKKYQAKRDFTTSKSCQVSVILNGNIQKLSTDKCLLIISYLLVWVKFDNIWNVFVFNAASCKLKSNNKAS